MRILHTMIRVTDLDRSLAFYTDILGMQLQRRMDFEEGRFTLAFLGFAGDEHGATLELTHNWDTDHYDLGNGYGHLAIEVEDVVEAVAAIRRRGGRITREPQRLGPTLLAFA
jgi:lactoylglutathione lyase